MPANKIIEIIPGRVIANSNQPLISDLKNGVMLLIDKPLEWTSFDVVNKIRSSLKYVCGIKKIKVGHAGTLDPMATGLLLVCVGKYTKSIDQLTLLHKSYQGIVKLGATTPSYDRESDEEDHTSIDHLDDAMIEECLSKFRGPLLQTPPIFSAIKIDGKTAHRLARRGADVTLSPRPITIHNLTLLHSELPFLELDISCSKGTYIRSLAHDIGRELGVGGYLHALRRTSISNYPLAEALSLEETIKWLELLPHQDLEI